MKRKVCRVFSFKIKLVLTPPETIKEPNSKKQNDNYSPHKKLSKKKL